MFQVLVSNLDKFRHQVTQVAFNNCAPFSKCIKKNDVRTTDDAEDKNLVMPMYNLIVWNNKEFMVLSKRWGN